jgi:pyruvate dehydrogenase E2 component (dihydrolipoamide acetyltransferase)
MRGLKMNRIQKDAKGRWYYKPDENLKRNAAHYPPGPISCSTTVTIDMTEANSLREKMERKNRVQMSATSLIIKAAANVLPDFPILCGLWESMDKIICPDPEEINIFGPIQVEDTIGFFFVDKANQKTLFQIADELDAQVNGLKSKSAAEVKWPKKVESLPSICITNVGILGPVEGGCGPMTSFATSRLGIGGILEKPIVKEGQITIRQVMNAVLDWDHRAMMASTPIKFLTRLKRNLEEPNTYLI